MCTVSPVISDGERLLILDNTYVNDSSVGTSVRLLHIRRLYVEIVAKTRDGVLMIDVMPSIGRDNRRHSRAKKIADQIAKDVFTQPVMVGWWLHGLPVFRYRGRQDKQVQPKQGAQ